MDTPVFDAFDSVKNTLTNSTFISEYVRESFGMPPQIVTQSCKGIRPFFKMGKPVVEYNKDGRANGYFTLIAELPDMGDSTFDKCLKLSDYISQEILSKRGLGSIITGVSVVDLSKANYETQKQSIWIALFKVHITMM